MYQTVLLCCSVNYWVALGAVCTNTTTRRSAAWPGVLSLHPSTACRGCSMHCVQLPHTAVSSSTCPLQLL